MVMKHYPVQFKADALGGGQPAGAVDPPASVGPPGSQTGRAAHPHILTVCRGPTHPGATSRMVSHVGIVMHIDGMQIVEVNLFGVRASVLRLTRRATPLRFEIFPMVHIGEPAFYAAVADRLRGCDLIVAEGVGGMETPDGRVKSDAPTTGSAAVRALTSSYRLPGWFRRSGLVVQNIPYHSLGVPVHYPDMTDEQFTAGWRQVPRWQRVLAVSASPLIGLDRLFFGSRRSLARHLELTDLDWHDQMADIDSVEELLGLLGDQRDRLLLTALDAIHQQRAEEAITVAVVYGAQHVVPVVYGMAALHGYGVRGAEWLNIFDFEP